MDMQPVARATALDLIRRGSFQNPRQEADRLTTILQPTTEDDALRAISFMFKCLPMAARDEEDKAVLKQGYVLALKGYPQWAIVEARDAFIAGRVEGYTSSFAPNPADLGREVGKRVSDYQLKLQRVKRQIREDGDTVTPRLSASAEFVAPSRAVPSGFYELEQDGSKSFTHDEYLAIQRRKRLPEGARWKAMTGQIFMPIGTKLAEPTEEQTVADDFNLYPDRDEWERIHAPKMTPEERAGREAA